MRLHWIGCLNWLAWPGDGADGAFRDVERPVIVGGICACHSTTILLWGEVRLRCPWKARGACSGQPGLGRGRSGAIRLSSVPFRSVLSVQPTWSLAFGDVEGPRGGWIGVSMDQNRHSGQSRAQTRKPCAIERDWIPAFAGMTMRLGMTIGSGVLCQRFEGRVIRPC